MVKSRNASFDFFALVVIFALSAMFIASASAVDVTFFQYSDPHYGARTSRDDPTPITRSPMVDVINSLPGTAYPGDISGVVDTPRGILMPGDMIDNGMIEGRYQTEWANFVADFGVNGEGRCKFPVFEGVGNHDVNPNLYAFNKVRERTLIRKQLGHIQNISSNGYHYSWDWDGVHFVNVNIFPGNIWEGEADAYGRGHDPLFARDFLEEDLRKNVGNSGRPVVIMQHFRPVDDNWWTHIAADRFHRLIQDYNVIAILVGHQGGGVNNRWRGIHWTTSNGRLVVWRIQGNELVGLERSATSWGTSVKRTIYHAYDQSGLPAVVSNGTWATALAATSATLSGRLVYEALPQTEVSVYWGTTDGGTQMDAWQHSKSIGVLKAGETGTVAIDGLQPWTDYFYRTAARNSEGQVWAAASIPFRTAGELPDGWQTEMIGYEQRAGGGAHFEDGLFTVRGSGRDIAERGQPIDNLQFAYRMLTGDGEIKARIREMEIRTREPKVGVMLRASTSASARNVAVLFNPRMGIRLSSRDNGGAGNWTLDDSVKTAPCWVRLVRSGDVVTGYLSQDGDQWTPISKPVTIELPDTLCVGLAVTAGNRDGSRLHTSTFDYVTVSQEE